MSWQDGISVPMPKIYVPDEDFVGKQVVLHMCEFHEDWEPAPGDTRKEISLTGNCNCKLKGKTITITGLKQTSRARFIGVLAIPLPNPRIWFMSQSSCQRNRPNAQELQRATLSKVSQITFLQQDLTTSRKIK